MRTSPAANTPSAHDRGEPIAQMITFFLQRTLFQSDQKSWQRQDSIFAHVQNSVHRTLFQPVQLSWWSGMKTRPSDRSYRGLTVTHQESGRAP